MPIDRSARPCAEGYRERAESWIVLAKTSRRLSGLVLEKTGFGKSGKKGSSSGGGSRARLQDATAVCDTLAAAVMMMMPLLLPLAARLVMWLLLRVAGSSHASQAGWSRARSSSPSSKSSTASLWRSRSADRPRAAQICSAAHHSASDVCGCHVAAEMPFAWFE
jgi:hypothetical protein